MSPRPDAYIDVFFSYSHRDELLRDALETHLALLKREGTIRTWHDRRIDAGREWEGEIDAHLETADLVLLLISPDFIASDYCFDREMTQLREDDAIHEPAAADSSPLQGAFIRAGETPALPVSLANTYGDGDIFRPSSRGLGGDPRGGSGVRQGSPRTVEVGRTFGSLRLWLWRSR